MQNKKKLERKERRAKTGKTTEAEKNITFFANGCRGFPLSIPRRGSWCKHLSFGFFFDLRSLSKGSWFLRGFRSLFKGTSLLWEQLAGISGRGVL